MNSCYKKVKAELLKKTPPMKNIIVVSLIVVMNLAWCEPAVAQPDWLIVPGVRAGSIRASSTEAELIRLYGKAHVTRGKFQYADAEPVDATIIWKSDPTRTAYVLWKEHQFGKVLQTVVIDATKSRWVLPSGIGIGTSMSALEKLNGRPFTINGFGWDYGGAPNWNGGKLEKALTDRGVSLHFGEGDWTVLSDEEKSKISGDIQVLTTLPALRKLNPRVNEIFVNLKAVRK